METLVCIEDKPLIIKSPLSFVNSYLYNQNIFLKSNNISPQCFELLMLIVNYYNNTGKGISCTQMLNYSSYSSSYYRRIYSFLNTLHNNGMVEYIGNGWNNCKLFAPTTKAIEGINNLVSSITV